MLHKMSGKQWDTMLAVHCTAPFRLIQASSSRPAAEVTSAAARAACTPAGP